MLNENKILFESHKNLKYFLNEGVSQNAITDAINHNKYVYVYYDDEVGDGNGTGGRTVAPFVYGVNGSGNPVIRAWEDLGDSASYKGHRGRRREDHEYHYDNKGRQKPGWRLFRVDRIKTFLPTGKKFRIDGNNIPPNYNPDDKDMTTIYAAIKIDSTPKIQGTDSIEKPDTYKQNLDKSFFDTQTKKFKNFFNLAKAKKDIDVNEIKDLYRIAKEIRKKSPDKLFVVANEMGDFQLKDEVDLNKLPSESIVGNLRDLYNKLVVDKQPISNTFFNKQKDVLKSKSLFN